MKLKWGKEKMHGFSKKVPTAERDNDWGWWGLFMAMIIMIIIFIGKIKGVI